MKWKNIKLNQEQKNKLILISIFGIIFIIVSIIISKIYFIPMYKNYQIEKAKREKILAKKEEAERIEYDFREFENKFKSLQVIEKIDNPENPAEIRAEKYYIVNPKEYAVAKNAIYSDKFVYIEAEKMTKYGIGNGKQLYIFEDAGVVVIESKKNHRYSAPATNGAVYILDGKLFFRDYRNYYFGNITDNYTDIESVRKATEQEMKKIEAIDDKIGKIEMFKYGFIHGKMEEEEREIEKERKKNSKNVPNTSSTPNIFYYCRDTSYVNKYLFTREEVEMLHKEKQCLNNSTSSNGYSYPSGNVLSKKELEKMEREENRRDRMDSDEWEYEDREEREYWESEEYWGEEGIEKEVY